MKTPFPMKLPSIQCILVELLSLSCALTVEDYFCDGHLRDPTLITNKTEGTITTLYQGQSYYPDNMRCEWVMDAGVGKRILLTVVRSHLQWAPESAICMGGYDYMAVYQGQTEESQEKVQWCGEQNPGSIISFGRYLYIKFESNSNNPYNYNGIQLNFTIFDDNSCPPGWQEDGENCLYLSSQRKNWPAAQRHCNYKWANLAIVSSQSTLDLTAEEAERKGVTEAWIGLHDKATEGDFRWIDGSKLSFSRLAPGHEERSEDFDCVVSQFRPDSVQWLAQDCYTSTYIFFCMMPKAGPTELHGLPVLEVDHDESSNTVALIIGVVVGGLGFFIVLIIIVIVCLHYRRKRQDERRANRMRNHFQGGPTLPLSYEEYRQQMEALEPTELWEDSERSVRKPYY